SCMSCRVAAEPSWAASQVSTPLRALSKYACCRSSDTGSVMVPRSFHVDYIADVIPCEDRVIGAIFRGEAATGQRFEGAILPQAGTGCSSARTAWHRSFRGGRLAEGSIALVEARRLLERVRSKLASRASATSRSAV